MSRAQETQPLPAPLKGALTPDGRVVFPSDPPTSARRRHRSWWEEIRRWTITISIFVFVASILLSASLIAAIYVQARSDQTRAVDAIVVMGAAQFDGRPSAVLRGRLDQALAAYEAGNAPLIVVSGGRMEGDRFTEAEASRDYLIEHGVPAAAIQMEDEGRDSWQSLQGVAEILKSQDLRRVLIVSDGFHLLRAKLMARDLGLAPFGVPAENSPIDPWSGTEFDFVVREAAGIVAFAWDQL